MLSSWIAKFANAFRGVYLGTRGQSSFVAHILIAVAAIAVSIVLRVGTGELALILLCIAVVLSAEMFNSSIEALARAITSETNPHIRDALDIASGAVLTVAFGSAAVGAIVFCSHIGDMLSRW